MLIRPSKMADVEAIVAIYDRAREFMTASGNGGQWINGYPQRSLVQQDIEQGHSYVCCEGDEILAVFYFAIEAEPNYAEIYEGQWKNDETYGVVHRIAVSGRQKGVAAVCLDWCFQQISNLRIDTHKDNLAMQKVLKNLDYQYCGIIHLADGAERLAYQKHDATVPQTHQGSCLCGTVTFEVHGRFERFFFCHCNRCQKVTGSAHAANLFAHDAKLIWLSGETEKKTYQVPDTRFTRCFCTHCGSALPVCNPETGMVKVPAGSLDSDLAMAPTNQIFLEDRALWDKTLQEEAPQS
jgi:RimJ/RimL family protein N-acetyltransferase